jgi:hypothetical protein
MHMDRWLNLCLNGAQLTARVRRRGRQSSAFARFYITTRSRLRYEKGF